MIAKEKWSRWYEDNLVLRVIPKKEVKFGENLIMYSQRKRLPDSTSDFDREVQRRYLKSTVHAVSFIRVEKKLRIGESLDYLDKLRFSREKIEYCWRYCK